MLSVTLTILYLFAVPLGVMLLAKRWTFINKISPMMVLYIIGLAVGNSGIIDTTAFATSETVSNVTVLLAIPLMLVCCDFKGWSTKNVTKAFLTGLASVLIVILAGYFIFRPECETLSHDNYAKVSAVMTGIYTGGIPNIGAISKAVALPNDLYLLVTSYDLIITGLYLIFVIFFGKVVFRKLLPPQTPVNEGEITEPEVAKESRGRRFWSKVSAVGIALVVAAVAYGVSMVIPTDNSVAVIILVLTTLSLALSFCKPLKRFLGNTFDLGLYFVYVFCLSIATMVNIHDLDLIGNLHILWYIAFTIFGSLVLQILFAKIFKIDGDTVLVSSIALINSPPFVPMVAAILKNRDVVIVGLAIGLLGYAIGNYLGIGIYYLLAAM